MRRKQRKEIITTGQIRKCSYSISTQRLQGGLFSVIVAPLVIKRRERGEVVPPRNVLIGNLSSLSMRIFASTTIANEADYCCGFRLITTLLYVHRNSQITRRWLNDQLNKGIYHQLNYNDSIKLFCGRLSRSRLNRQWKILSQIEIGRLIWSHVTNG